MSYNNSINSGVTGILNATSGGSISGVTLTQYNALVGGAGNAITSIAPGSTSGVPLVSNGASSNPSFSTASVSGGGTGATSFTAYMPITGGTSSTSAFQSVATGTSNYVLSSGGSSALPTWVNTATLGGGNLVLIAQNTPSGVASTSFTTGITSTYNNYFLIIDQVTGSTSPTAFNFQCQISTNGGSSYISSGYLSGGISLTYASATWGTNQTSTSAYFLGRVPANTANFSANYYLYNLTSGSNYLGISGETMVMGGSGGSSRQGIVDGSYDGTATVNAIQISPTSGTMTGTLTLFGILE